MLGKRMYYKDRAEAGRRLADSLKAYRSKNAIIIALSESSVLVAEQIAKALHASMALYMIKGISLPGESQHVAAISSTGHFRYNDTLSPGEVHDISSEFRNHIEQEKFKKMHEMNVLLGGAGELDKNRLRHHYVILVADALADGFSITMVYEYLKTVATAKIVAAVPVVAVPAIDRIHRVADEMHISSIADNFMGVDHYFDKREEPALDDVLNIISNLSLHWQSPARARHAREHHMGKRQPSWVLYRPKIGPATS